MTAEHGPEAAHHHHYDHYDAAMADRLDAFYGRVDARLNDRVAAACAGASCAASTRKRFTSSSITGTSL